MTDPHYTAVMLLVDRSGSMVTICNAAEQGINEFVKGQASATGRRTIRIAQFDNRYVNVCESENPVNVPDFVLTPRGSTALLDAMARAITEFGAELAAMPEDQRPGNVVFAVMTDGQENASQECTYAGVKELVDHQEKVYGWQVLYLGANQDAVAEGARLGVPAARSMTYAASSAGTRSATGSLTDSVAVAASGAPITYTDAQRKDANR